MENNQSSQDSAIDTGAVNNTLAPDAAAAANDTGTSAPAVEASGDISADAATGETKQTADEKTPAADVVDTSVTAAASDAVEENANAAPSADAAKPETFPTFGIHAQLALQQIADYLNVMAVNRPITLADGVRYQTLLYRSITTIINRADSDFNDAFAYLLSLFEKNSNGAFHERYAMRFMEHLPLSEDDRRGFQRLVHLLRLAAPAKGRAIALKQINFSAALQYGITEPGRQRVLNYFNQ